MTEISDEGSSAQAERNVWNTEEREVLVKYVREFKDKDRHQRRKLLASQVLPEFFKKCRPDATGVARQQLKTIIRDWFYNQCRSKEPAMKIWPKRVSFRSLVIEEYNDKIKAMAIDQGVHPADPTYIGVFQNCVSSFIDNMKDEEIQSLEGKKKDVDKGSYSEDMAIKAAKKNGPKLTRAVDRACFQKMGMRRITWEMHLKEPGKMVISGQDYMNELTPIYGKSFKEMYPKVWASWAEAFAAYARYILKLEQSGSPDINAAEYIFRGLDERPLDRSTDGYPILPERLQRDGKEIAETADYAKKLMRKFLAEHYAVACQVPKASVPYKLLSTDPSAFAAPHYWPPGITIKDPSAMIAADVHKALHFWRERKETHPAREVFCFRQVLKGRLGYNMIPSEYPAPAATQSDAESTPASRRPAVNATCSRRNKSRNKRKQGVSTMPQELPQHILLKHNSGINADLACPPFAPIPTNMSSGSQFPTDLPEIPIGQEEYQEFSGQCGLNHVLPPFQMDDLPMPHITRPLSSCSHSNQLQDNAENDLLVVCPDILPVTTNLETHPLTPFNLQYGNLQSASPPIDLVLSHIQSSEPDVRNPNHHLFTNISADANIVQILPRPKPKARQGISLSIPLEDTLGKNPHRSNFLQESSTSLAIPISNPRKRSWNDGLDLSLMKEECGKGKRVKRSTARALGGK